MPKPEKSGFIPTLNRQGYMASKLDEFIRKFVEHAGTCDGPVVDVGAAYGLATIPALEAGAKVVAIDLDERHLEILRQRTPEQFRGNLRTIAASFPDDISFGKGSIDAFLVARVVHFFSPTQLLGAARRLFEWSCSGGRVVLTAESPYLSNWETFIPVYEDRRRTDRFFAGYVDDAMKYAPDRGVDLPKEMLLLDPQTLDFAFGEAGFVIEESRFFARPEFPEDLRRDGRESVGMICRKP